VGQKVHPVGFRLGVIKDWQARWYGEKNYTEQLKEDLAIRQLIGERLKDAGVSSVDIERRGQQVTVTINTAKPGIVIGKGGVKVEELRKELEKTCHKMVKLNISEIRRPETDAKLVAESIAAQLGKRVAYKKVMKQAVARAMKEGIKGIKISISGRLAGAEMARREWEKQGRIPLQTLRADIDYAQVHALTTYGRIGVKVWIYKGDILAKPGTLAAGATPTASVSTGPREVVS